MTDSTANHPPAPQLRNPFAVELESISQWWVTHSTDETDTGFYGEIDSTGQPVPEARKGLVLNSRILWFFSEVAAQRGCAECRRLAKRAYLYLMNHFYDCQNGGFVWEVDHRGATTNDRKQVYGQAFCLYGLVAYYRLSGEQVVLDQAVELFRTIETKCRERSLGGYTEAFRGDWGGIDDYRLSERDCNFPKTLNTHLHLLEAYTSFHAVVGTEESASALRNCVTLFQTKFRRPDFHFRMFLDSQWEDHSKEISYGHEIELSWLMCEASHALGDDSLTKQIEVDAVRIADQALTKGIGDGGQLIERVQFDKPIDQTSVWWVQAEAMVGFFNAYQLSGEQRFLAAMKGVWSFVLSHHKTDSNSEWLWSPTRTASALLPASAASSTASDNAKHYLAGFWKSPYHNGRAMIELANRTADTGSLGDMLSDSPKA